MLSYAHIFNMKKRTSKKIECVIHVCRSVITKLLFFRVEYHISPKTARHIDVMTNIFCSARKVERKKRAQDCVISIEVFFSLSSLFIHI